ncbi:MAG: helix-turn-helix domain-containing protein [Planctomycetaceae bacterium]
MDKLTDFLRISEAAGYLGVSSNTLRNWENAGKIAAHRHPVNGYRLFKQEELDKLLRPIQPSDVVEPNDQVNKRKQTRNPPKKPR